MIKLFVALGFIAGDIITGIIKAIGTTGLNSTILRKGLIRKSTEIITLVGAWGVDLGIAALNIPVQFEVLTFICVYLCIMELISMLENLGEVNPVLARLFTPYIQKLKDKQAEMENKDNDTDKPAGQ